MLFFLMHEMANLDWFDGIEVAHLQTHSGSDVIEFIVGLFPLSFGFIISTERRSLKLDFWLA